MKYNLDDLHWQEFELLTFKVVQAIVASEAQLIDGGSDKGRDVVHYGGSHDFRKEWSGNWIFQTKHKSKQSGYKSALISDLRFELDKVFIENELPCDNYVLVTNKTITGDLYDDLSNVFDSFVKTKKLKEKNFAIIDYSDFESCIEKSDYLKWSYPNIISHPEFELLIRDANKNHLKVRRQAWLKSIKQQRDRFVFTNFFQSANQKLENYSTIILSGPPKSGKTFNAEILALNYFSNRDFEPVLIDDPEDIELSFESDRKQIFICDDAFGKHSLSYNAEQWITKLDRIFNLADESHLFIFTSREYIFRAFINIGDHEAQNALKKILVESHNYSKYEKLALLHRYTIQSKISESDKTDILSNELEIIGHKNFSPETIRAFFYNIKNDSGETQIQLLRQHIRQPDAYLSVVFRELSEVKKSALLSVLCSIDNKKQSINEKFVVICKDLNINKILNTNLEFEELDDSILRILKSDKTEEISFYHPSMNDYLINELVAEPTGVFREVVVKNANLQLLQLSLVKSVLGSKIKSRSIKRISLSKLDIPSLEVGILRMLNNPDLSLPKVAILFRWFQDENHSMYLKISEKSLFQALRQIKKSMLEVVWSQSFFDHHIEEPCDHWSYLMATIKGSSTPYNMNLSNQKIVYLDDLLKLKQKEDHFWELVFRITSYTSYDIIIEIIGKDWLNNFFLKLKSDIDKLGKEVYGNDFPDFKEYQRKVLLNNGVVEKVKSKPTNSWYPRFLEVKNRMDVLKEAKGSTVAIKILNPLVKSYEAVKKMGEYAKNRHKFNVKKGWW